MCGSQTLIWYIWRSPFLLWVHRFSAKIINNVIWPTDSDCMKKRLLKIEGITSRHIQTVLLPKNWLTGWLITKRPQTERQRLNLCRHYWIAALSIMVSEKAAATMILSFCLITVVQLRVTPDPASAAEEGPWSFYCIWVTQDSGIPMERGSLHPVPCTSLLHGDSYMPVYRDVRMEPAEPRLLRSIVYFPLQRGMQLLQPILPSSWLKSGCTSTVLQQTEILLS